MKEEGIRKIIISDEVMEKMNQEFIERLQKEEKIEIVVMPAGEVFDQKMLQHIANGGPYVFVEPSKEEITDFTNIQNAVCEALLERENETKDMCKKIKENYEEIMRNLDQYGPQCISPSKEYNTPRKKYNIPRTIGKPSSMRKGGR